MLPGACCIYSQNERRYLLRSRLNRTRNRGEFFKRSSDPQFKPGRSRSVVNDSLRQIRLKPLQRNSLTERADLQKTLATTGFFTNILALHRET